MVDRLFSYQGVPVTYPPPQPPGPPPYGQQPASGQPYSAAPYNPAGPQPMYQPYPQPGQDGPKRYLGMSGGVLATVIVLIVVLCCIAPIAACFGFGGLNMLTEASNSDPTAEVISCEVDDSNQFLQSTEVTVKVTNPGRSRQFVSVEIEVRNASGTKVGDGFAFVTVSANSSAQETTTIFQDTTGGTTCVITDVS
jgi:hypothetical protein